MNKALPRPRGANELFPPRSDPSGPPEGPVRESGKGDEAGSRTRSRHTPRDGGTGLDSWSSIRRTGPRASQGKRGSLVFCGLGFQPLNSISNVLERILQVLSLRRQDLQSLFLCGTCSRRRFAGPVPNPGTLPSGRSVSRTRWPGRSPSPKPAPISKAASASSSAAPKRCRRRRTTTYSSSPSGHGSHTQRSGSVSSRHGEFLLSDWLSFKHTRSSPARDSLDGQVPPVRDPHHTKSAPFPRHGTPSRGSRCVSIRHPASFPWVCRPRFSFVRRPGTENVGRGERSHRIFHTAFVPSLCRPTICPKTPPDRKRVEGRIPGRISPGPRVP